MNDEPEMKPVAKPELFPPGGWRPLVALVLALTAFSIGFRIIVDAQLEHSSVLFILLPGLFAILLGMVPTRQSALGFALKAITVALLMSMVVLGEGMICVLMAAPIIYGVVFVTWALVRVTTRFLGPRTDRTKVRCSLVVPLALISLEGVTEDLSFNRKETVVVSRITDVPPAAIEARLAAPPRFDDALPTSLQLGFPRPQWIEADGIERGDQWRVRFAGGEGVPGTLVLEVVERAPGFVRFAALQDTSKIAHWLRWREAVVTWEPDGSGGTRVTWALAYDRELDPAWYFGPLERFAVERAAEYLVDNLVVSR